MRAPCPACGTLHDGPFPYPCDDCGELINPPRHIVGLSGGKDSSALAVWLVENEPRDYDFICNETGNELPEMQAHWAKLEGILGKPLIRVRHSNDLIGTINDLQMLPSFHARWCTRILKIEPTIEYFANLPPGSVLYVGLRADEEERQGLFGEDIKLRFPMREIGWRECDVWDFLNARGITIPDRTDCALCPYQRLGQWRALWQNHPDLYWQGVAIEVTHGHTFRSDGRDTWPASLAELAKEFERGRPLRQFKGGNTCRVCSL